MSKNLSYALSSGEEDENQLFVTYGSTPFLVQAGDPQSGVSISASYLNNSGTYTFGGVFPGNAQVDVLRPDEAAR